VARPSSPNLPRPKVGSKGRIRPEIVQTGVLSVQGLDFPLYHSPLRKPFSGQGLRHATHGPGGESAGVGWLCGGSPAKELQTGGRKLLLGEGA